MNVESSVAGSSALIVVGMHRSGTSAFTAALSRIGFDLGRELLSPSDDNPHGFWENTRFVRLHEDLLAELGTSWDDPRPLPGDWLDRTISGGYLDRLRDLVVQEFSDSRRWAVKDPRICRVLPLWTQALASLRVRAAYVNVVRHPSEVAASLHARNGWGGSIGEMLWLRYVLESVSAIEKERRTVVTYDQLLHDPVSSLGKVIGDLALGEIPVPMLHSLRAQFYPEERHHRHSPDQRGIGAFSELAQNVYAALDGIANGDGDWGGLGELSNEFQSMWNRHESALDQVLVRLHEVVKRDKAAHVEISRLQRAIDEKEILGSHLDDMRASLALIREHVGVVRDASSDQFAELADLRMQLFDTKSEQSRLVDELTAHKVESKRLREDLAEVRASLGSVLGRVELANSELDVLKTWLGQAEAANSSLASACQAAESRKAAEDVENRLILDGLQAQITLLQSASDDLMHRTRWMRSLTSLPTRGLQKLKAAMKAAIRAAVLSYPGDAATKQLRLQRTKDLFGAVRSGFNGAAIAADIDTLAEGRWTEIPEYPSRNATASTEPEIDISIVLYRSGRWVEGFVRSLRGLQYPRHRIRLLFRDHSPDEETHRLLDAALDGIAEEFSEIIYSRGENKGFGAGHNHNFKHSAADYFLVCNIDGCFYPDSLLKIARVAGASGPEVAAFEFRQTPYEHPKYYDPVTSHTSWVSGACVMFRARAYRKVGGFDDAIFMYGEDVDLSYRLRSLGFRLAYVPAARFHHESYEEAEEFKPLQFHGSTLANMLLRLRFGGAMDIAAIPLLWHGLSRTAGELGVAAGHRQNTFVLLRKAPGFFFSRFGMKRIPLPFAGWDYGIRREGAFEKIDAIPASQPLVSILIRTYRGRGALLRHALMSVAQQTYARIEAVVVEDKGDTLRDQVATWARELGLDVRYFANVNPQSNRCLTGNIALHEARGEFCCFLDDDDLLYADHVEYLVSCALKNPDVDACYSLAWEVKIIRDPDSPPKYREVMHSTLSGMRREFDAGLLRRHNYIPIQAILFKRALYAIHGGFDPRLENLEDWELWRRYSSNAGFKFCPKTTSLYHVPFDPEQVAARQALMDRYYPIAKAIGDQAESRTKSQSATLSGQER